MFMKSNSLVDILVKAECETDPRYGCYPEKRPISEYIRNGIVNVDKPSGPTSHQVSSWVKRILNIKKAGHSGTLDPRVTGVLPIGLEDGTKALYALLISSKEYAGIISIHDDVTDSKIKETFEYFTGKIHQKPPLKSAVKRQLREKNIYKIDMIERKNRQILFRVECESGTYIRKLCHDIGLVLGTGAHMQELRRTRVGPFNEDNIITLHDLKDVYEFYLENKDEKTLRTIIMPIEKGVEHLKKIWIKDSTVSAVCHGANLNAPGVSKLCDKIEQNELIAIMSLKNELVAIGRSLYDSQSISNLEKGTIVDLERVIMSPNVYPKKWHKA